MAPDAGSDGRPALVLATGVGGAGDAAACAAAVGAAAATADELARPAPVAVAELGSRSKRGPTMLASVAARDLERRLATGGFRASARGSLCWLGLADGEEGLVELERAFGELGGARLVVAVVPAAIWSPALGHQALVPSGALVRCELPESRPLAALITMELRERGILARIDRHGCGPLAARRALAGLDPGGAAGRRARRVAHAFLSTRARRA